MRTFWLQTALVFLVGLAPVRTLADTASEGWNWSVGCPGDGTEYPSGPFAASTQSGFIGSGTCSRTGTHFTQFTFTSSTGAINTSTLFGLHTGDWLIVPPTLSSDYAPIYSVTPTCPYFNKTLNWILVQWDTGMRTMTDTYVLGTATYSTSSGITVTAQYDVSGAAYWLGVVSMPGTCTDGLYPISGQSTADLNGKVYFAMDGGGVYKTNPGHATFFMPQYTVNASTDLGGLSSVQAITFDSYQTTGTRNAAVSTNAAGTVFTVKLYTASGVAAGTIDFTASGWTDTINISHVNTPVVGMLLGTVTRTGSSGPYAQGAVACIVNRGIDVRVICAGQSPAGIEYPYTVAFVVEGANVLGQPDTMSQENVALGFNLPYASSSDGTRYYVADYSNNRVLIWNTIPTASQTPPNVVLGQANLFTNAAGLSASNFDNPESVQSDGTRLFVTDSYYSRVLIWNTIPTSNFSPANVVVGQGNMTSGVNGPTASNLTMPTFAYSDTTRLYICDNNDHRILIFNSIPVSNGASANIVLGQRI